MLDGSVGDGSVRMVNRKDARALANLTERELVESLEERSHLPLEEKDDLWWCGVVYGGLALIFGVDVLWKLWDYFSL